MTSPLTNPADRPAASRSDSPRLYDRRTQIVNAPGWTEEGDELCGLMLLDVDNYLDVSAAYGALVADVAVQHVMDCIDVEVRPTDVLVGFGGAEFAVVLPGADADYADDVAERVRSAVNRTTMMHDGDPIQLMVSVGATGKFPASEDMVGSLLAAADERLAVDKRAGSQ